MGFKFQRNKMFLPRSLVKNQYCEEPPWPWSSELGLRPPGFEFRIMCLDGMLSHSSHHPHDVLLAQLSLYVHKGGLKPHSFHFSWTTSRTFRIEMNCNLSGLQVAFLWINNLKQRTLCLKLNYLQYNVCLQMTSIFSSTHLKNTRPFKLGRYLKTHSLSKFRSSLFFFEKEMLIHDLNSYPVKALHSII